MVKAQGARRNASIGEERFLRESGGSWHHRSHLGRTVEAGVRPRLFMRTLSTVLVLAAGFTAAGPLEDSRASLRVVTAGLESAAKCADMIDTERPTTIATAFGCLETSLQIACTGLDESVSTMSSPDFPRPARPVLPNMRRAQDECRQAIREAKKRTLPGLRKVAEHMRALGLQLTTAARAIADS